LAAGAGTAALLLAAACGGNRARPLPSLAPAEASMRAAAIAPGLDYYPDRIIVKFTPLAAPPPGVVPGGESLPPSVLYQNPGPARFARFLASRYGITIEQEAYVRSINWACFAAETPERAEELLALLPRAYPDEVEYAEYDGRFEPCYVPNDPAYPAQMWGMVKISAEAAWDTAKGSGVKIAVIDSGVRYDGNTESSRPDHEDLDDNVMHPPDYWPEEKLDFVDNDNIPDDDDYGHGTHVAGTAAAVGDNGKGVVGVAYQAKIIPIKIYDFNSPLYYSRVIQAITLAVELGADVVNMSFAGTSMSKAMREAVDDAYSEGVLLVGAAGNHNRTKHYYPAAYPHVIAVGATKSDDGRCSFSNYGPWLDIAAPGTAIYSTYNRFRTDYYTEEGTSMAAPHVSGAAALLRSAFPALSVDEVRAKLEASGAELDDTEWENTTIKRLDVGAAVNFALGSPPTITITSPDDGDTVDGLIAFSATAGDSDGSVLKVYFYAGAYLLAIDTTPPFTTDWDTTRFPNTQYALTATAYDNQGQRTSDSISVTVANSSLQPDYFTDFESGTSGWWTLDEGGPTSWHLTTSDSYSPTHSFKMGHTGAGTYGSREYDLLFSPVFSLAGIEHARVKFYHRYALDTYGDEARVCVHTGEGEYFVMQAFTGSQASWGQANVLIDDFLGQSVQIVFLLESNNSAHFEGWYIDDFRLVKSTAPPQVHITSHEDDDTVSGTITVAADASDDVEISKVELYIDGVLFGTDYAAPYSFTCDTRYLHGGDRVFKAVAYDEFPLTASDEVTLIVRNQVIDWFGPPSAVAGAEVNIGGNYFLALGSDEYDPDTDHVFFTGAGGEQVEAPVSWWTRTVITCQVPADATIGPLYVALGRASVATSSDFTIKPTIDELDPALQVVGADVTLRGSGFLPERGDGSVTFNGIQALAYPSWGNREIVVTVPPAVTEGPVKVTTLAGTSNGVNFIPLPHITGLSSSRAYVGKSPFTIMGTSFRDTGVVYFHDGVLVPSANILLWQPTQIVLRVPEGAVTGDIYVVAGGYESNHEQVTITLPPPTLHSLSQR